MCWMCDHPNATKQDYLAHLRSIIADRGWAVQFVEGSKRRAPHAYTVGLTPHGKPELLVTGMAAYRAVRWLNEVASHLRHAAVPVPGERVPLIGGRLIEFVQVDQPTAHLLVACEFYGARVRALQVVHADDRGHWPWDTGYRGGRGGQPVLGVRGGLPKAS
ncbi:MAG: DUF4262 domain-containing protein [Streptosporangiaceae bacterium]